MPELCSDSPFHFGIELIAEVCHEANRVLQRAYGEKVSPTWIVTDDEIQASAIDGVRNALLGATPEESHENWMRFKLDNGWVYGPVKDAEAKTHPCLVPYEDLPLNQQAKDALFTSIVRALS